MSDVIDLIMRFRPDPSEFISNQMRLNLMRHYHSKLNESLKARDTIEIAFWAGMLGCPTSDVPVIWPHRVLTSEAQDRRDDYEIARAEMGGCTCFRCPPCGVCTHEGNPLNQEEDESCWTVSWFPDSNSSVASVPV